MHTRTRTHICNLVLEPIHHVDENHVRCEYHDKHSYTKMTSRRGSRMISKAERRPERHRRDYMGRVHVHTLLSGFSRIFPSLSMSSLISTRIHSRPLPPAISSFPLHDEHVARRLHPHLDRFYLLLPFRKAIFSRRHSRIAVQAVVLKADYQETRVFRPQQQEALLFTDTNGISCRKTLIYGGLMRFSFAATTAFPSESCSSVLSRYPNRVSPPFIVENNFATRALRRKRKLQPRS